MGEVTSHQRCTSRRPMPQTGDAVASRSTARSDRFAISVTPDPAHAVAERFDDAIASIRAIARKHSVDAWYTCNHTHFLLVAHHRPETTS